MDDESLIQANKRVAVQYLTYIMRERKVHVTDVGWFRRKLTEAERVFTEELLGNGDVLADFRRCVSHLRRAYLR